MSYGGFKCATWGEQMFYSFDQSSFFQNDIHWTWSTDQGLRKQDINQSPGFSRVLPSSPWRKALSPCSSLGGQLSIFYPHILKNEGPDVGSKHPGICVLPLSSVHWPFRHKDPCGNGRTPACGNETLKFEQESTGHLGKCWCAYRRKAGWLIWKGTWRFLGVEHVLLCPLTFWTQESITEPLYRLPIILDGFWHE